MLRRFDDQIAEKTVFLNNLINSFNWGGGGETISGIERISQKHAQEPAKKKAPPPEASSLPRQDTQPSRENSWVSLLHSRSSGSF